MEVIDDSLINPINSRKNNSQSFSIQDGFDNPSGNANETGFPLQVGFDTVGFGVLTGIGGNQAGFLNQSGTSDIGQAGSVQPTDFVFSANLQAVTGLYFNLFFKLILFLFLSSNMFSIYFK